MIRIGITGGIGSGKSYISALLREQRGIPVYDCDTEAKRLTAESASIREQLIQLIGPDVYDGQGLVKPRLAAYLFESEENAARINGIIHPAVRADFRQWQLCQTTPVVALESAILFESGFHSEVDWVLYVDAPTDMRLQRAMQRDGASREQIAARMALQQTAATRQRADYVILNDGTPDDILLQQLDTLLRDITNTKY